MLVNRRKKNNKNMESYLSSQSRGEVVRCFFKDGSLGFHHTIFSSELTSEISNLSIFLLQFSLHFNLYYEMIRAKLECINGYGYRTLSLVIVWLASVVRTSSCRKPLNASS
jgi:hypothetical protein